MLSQLNSKCWMVTLVFWKCMMLHTNQHKKMHASYICLHLNLCLDPVSTFWIQFQHFGSSFNILDRVCMGCREWIGWIVICGEMRSMFRSWCSELFNELAVRSCFWYISCICSGHSDAMHETAGGSFTSTRRSLVSSCSTRSVRWLISVVSWYDWNSIWNVVLVLRFWPNNIQQDEDCSGTCFTTHMSHFKVFSFNTKAPGMISCICCCWLRWFRCLCWLRLEIRSIFF